MRRLKETIAAPLNFEMAATEQMLDIALKIRPHACCLVPEKRTERTTEGGLDVVGGRDRLAPFVDELSRAGIRVSLFIEPSIEALAAARSVKAPVVELHTGAWCNAHLHGRGRPRPRPNSSACARRRRKPSGSGSNATPATGWTSTRRARSPPCRRSSELNIGHFLIGEAMFIGLDASVRRMIAAIAQGRQDDGEGQGGMIIGLGIDLCDIRRIERMLEHYGDRFPHRCFTPIERAKADGTQGARRHLRQAFRRQGGLRQGARHRDRAGRVAGSTWAWSTIPRAARRWS